MLDIYKNKNKVETITALGVKSKVSIIEKVSYENGINVFYKGAEYPMKGLVSPETLWSVDIVKAIFIEVFKLRPSIISILSSFNRIGNKIMGVYFLKDEYRMAGMKELEDITYRFIFSYTSNKLVACQFAQIFSHLLEYDNAYRLRLIDIASETRAEWLRDSPRKELKRLLLLMCDREHEHHEIIRRKYRAVIFILRLFLLLPKAKRAFKHALLLSNWSLLQYDNIDRYWACLRTDYNFMGKTYEERLKMLKDSGLSLPDQIEVV